MKSTPNQKTLKKIIPKLALALQEKISQAKQVNPVFKKAFDEFLSSCASNFEIEIKESDIENLLVQHLLTERIFKAIFFDSDFIQQNPIALQLEKLSSIFIRSVFLVHDFFKDLEFFYISVEADALIIKNETDRQRLLNKVYELFFQSLSKNQADRNGIVYTPQPIVGFMVKFTNSLLRKYFDKCLSNSGVTIIDPCVGTGNFILEILHQLQPSTWNTKYESEIFCNELMLLSYYIASVNIEYSYFKQNGTYKTFQNIQLQDTLTQSYQPEKAENQSDTDLTVIIGNPPYNLKQSRDLGNRSLKHKTIDQQIAETYIKSSTAVSKQINYDPCIKFIRWATNRLDRQIGVVCFITNNVFMHSTASDGIRENLMKDFNRIYHIDLGGDMRLNPKEARGNVFGITVGVGISFFVKHKKYDDHKIFYLNLRNEHFVKEDYFALLDNFTKTKDGFDDFDWVEGSLENGMFIFGDENKKLSLQYNDFISLFNKEGNCIFHSKTPGVKTHRDEWAYHANKECLTKNIQTTIDFYNSEVDRLEHYIRQNRIDLKHINIEAFVNYDNEKIKWSPVLKENLLRLNKVQFSADKIVAAAFRPFVSKFLYHDHTLNDRPSKLGELMQIENQFIALNGLGSQRPFGCFITKLFPDHNITTPSQIFPLFHFKNNQAELNISNWILMEYRKLLFNAEITKEQIFYAVYGILHHDGFRTVYTEFLKSSEPKVPLLANHFFEISEIGFQLAQLHLNLESADEYPLDTIENKAVKKYYSIEKLTISKNGVLVYNAYFSFLLPEKVNEYKVCGRSPLEWFCDQYENLELESDKFIRLLKKAITVSIQTIEQIKILNKIELN